MKIQKIFIRNLNSLAGDHPIDFNKQPLANSTLFAITGPTGSGKSTIIMHRPAWIKVLPVVYF
jgi:DNA repair protein SbcC/Rad50